MSIPILRLLSLKALKNSVLFPLSVCYLLVALYVSHARWMLSLFFSCLYYSIILSIQKNHKKGMREFGRIWYMSALANRSAFYSRKVTQSLDISIVKYFKYLIFMYMYGICVWRGREYLSIMSTLLITVV